MHSTNALCDQKVVVVTGAAGRNGLGFATAQMLAAHGAKVAILDLHSADPHAAAQRLGKDHIGIVADVTDHVSCKSAIAKVAERYGRVDALVNNAGIVQARDAVSITASDYDAVLNVNLRGALNMAQAVLPVMCSQGSGSIICISSIAARRGGGLLGGAHYAASKAGVLGLARALAREYGRSGVRVNSVCPSMIATDMSAEIPKDRAAEIADQVPLGRIGVPDDVAGCVVFLTSDLSKYCTGVTLDVNGGLYIH